MVRDSDGTGGSTAREFLSPPAYPSSGARDSDGTCESTVGEFLFPKNINHPGYTILTALVSVYSW